MYATLFSSTSALVFASLLSSATAGIFGREQVCTHDVVYKGLWDNPEIDYAATDYCISKLGLTPMTVTVATTTPLTTIAPTTSITGTETTTTTDYMSTATVTETSLILNDMKKRAAQAPAPTKRVEINQAGIEKFERLVARQVNEASAQYSAVISACSCRPGLNAGTNYITATAALRTITDEVVYSYSTTEIDTVHGGTTTVTQTINITSNVVSVITVDPVSKSPSSTWGNPWTDATTISSLDTTWSTSSSTSFSTSSSSPVTLEYRTTGSMSSTTDTVGPITTSTTTSGMTSSASMIPSGCPDSNGTYYPSPKLTCMEYQRVCGRSYRPVDFYDTEEYYPDPESCSAVCDAENRGTATPCLGIVWNTTATDGSPNCRQLKATDKPIKDPSAIALLLVPNPACQASSSQTPTTSAMSSPMPTMSTTWTLWSMNSSTFSPTTTGSIAVGPFNTTTSMTTAKMMNSTTTLMTTSNAIKSYTTTPVGPYNTTMPDNTTRSTRATWSSQNHTWTTHNHTWSPTTTWSTISMMLSTGGTGTISGNPINTSNSTCPASTITLISYDTKYNTMIMTTTIYVANLTTTTDLFTTTETADCADSTLTTTETDTLLTTVVSVDYTKTKTRTKVVATTTVTDTTTVFEAGRAKVAAATWARWWHRN